MYVFIMNIEFPLVPEIQMAKITFKCLWVCSLYVFDKLVPVYCLVRAFPASMFSVLFFFIMNMHVFFDLTLSIPGQSTYWTLKPGPYSFPCSMVVVLRIVTRLYL